MATTSKWTMTPSPLALAKTALQVANTALPPYSSKFSKKDFTQAQLMTIFILQQFFKTDYRGITQYLYDWTDVRQALQLKKVPHYSTLCYAHKLLPKRRRAGACWLPSLRAQRPTS
jgi:hypothetical protein